MVGGVFVCVFGFVVFLVWLVAFGFIVCLFYSMQNFVSFHKGEYRIPFFVS